MLERARFAFQVFMETRYSKRLSALSKKTLKRSGNSSRELLNIAENTISEQETMSWYDYPGEKFFLGNVGNRIRAAGTIKNFKEALPIWTKALDMQAKLSTQAVKDVNTYYSEPEKVKLINTAAILSKKAENWRRTAGRLGIKISKKDSAYSTSKDQLEAGKESELSTKELIFQQAKNIISQHQDKFAATFKPNDQRNIITAWTRFNGYDLQIARQEIEGRTTISVDLFERSEAITNQPRYRLDVSSGKEIEANFAIANEALSNHSENGSPEEVLGNLYFHSSEGKIREFYDKSSEVNMSSQEALIVLQNAENFELPKNGNKVTLTNLIKKEPQVVEMLFS